MISATSSLSPYSYQPPLAKPAGQAGADTTEKSVTTDKAPDSAAKKNDPETQAAQKDPKAAQEKKQVAELKQVDRKVRVHEQAHLAAAGGLAMGGASFTYRRGPDGQQYAVGGEVHIDVSPGKTPQETIAKAERIKAAALAPADPSGQDRSVASQAAQMQRDAQIELTKQKLDKSAGREDPSATDSGTAQTAATDDQNSTSGNPPTSPATKRGIAGYRAASNDAGPTTGSRFSAAA